MNGGTRVSGNTVTLTRNVGVQGNLTVPAGVTLELTEDGGVYLMRDNITLTVNGILNVPHNGKFGIEQTATVNGNGTINLTGKGNLLHINGRNGKKLTLDGVTLIGVPDNNESLVTVSEGGELVLVSGAITGNTSNNGGGGVNVGNGGTFTMSGGTITGNNAVGRGDIFGGGVRVGEGSTFTMSGGEIRGNTATGMDGKGAGGGVFVHTSTFIMEGGAISGNSAIGSGGTEGGGVCMGWEGWDGGGTFTMSGGEISGNSGGGVSVLTTKATFTMSGGAITDNTATWASGVGVGLGATFTMKGGTISGNSGAFGGVGVGSQSTFTMEDGVISGNSAVANSMISGTGALGNGGGVTVEYKNGSAGTFIMKGGTIYGNVGNLPAGAAASLANTAGNGASLFVHGRAVAQYGKQAPFTSFASLLTEAVDDILVRSTSEVYTSFGGRGTGRTISVNPETGVLTVTPVR